MAAHTQGVGFATDGKGMSEALADERPSFGVMDLDTVTMVEGLIPMTTTPPFSCRFPNPSRRRATCSPHFLGVPIEAPGGANSCETEWRSSLTF